MTRTLKPGPARLYRTPEIEGDGTTQVAVAWDVAGSPSIMLRIGLLIAALDLDGAEAVGRELVAAVASARRETPTRPT